MQSSLQARCCQCSLSSIRIYHSLAHSALVALSFTIKTGYWEVVERSLPPCALRRDVWGLSCCRSNLAHKRRCLLAVSPVTVQWWNNPLILCYLSGRSWVLTEAPNPFWLAEHILSWVVVEQGLIYWPEGWWDGVGWGGRVVKIHRCGYMTKVHLTPAIYPCQRHDHCMQILSHFTNV